MFFKAKKVRRVVKKDRLAGEGSITVANILGNIVSGQAQYSGGKIKLA